MTTTFGCWTVLALVVSALVGMPAGAASGSLRAAANDERDLAVTTTTEQSQQPQPYYTLTAATLGMPNPDAAIGNPLKGLVESPYYNQPPYDSDVPLAVEFYYMGAYYMYVFTCLYSTTIAHRRLWFVHSLHSLRHFIGVCVSSSSPSGF